MYEGVHRRFFGVLASIPSTEKVCLFSLLYKPKLLLLLFFKQIFFTQVQDDS